MTTIRHLALGAATVAALALGGCGNAADSAAPAPQPASPAAAAAPSAAPQAPATKRIEITVAGGKVQGGLQRIEIPLGTPVTLVVTSDENDEVHLHGYDREAELTAGTPATIEFTADQPGVFELELHGSGTQLAKLEVR
ncbi:hypothetical protein [Pseudonocardia endophytica]|uniref:Cupredoxin-like protein n=1 Tax=Pseudonocardia endophytica TaxID=401976 RepID=A0A4V2PJ20_PSEEN|nr:hypothetical protein [Pseudonocardia endophytica]TCK26816.1 hypothetical protein EV378_2661 [Pseudonocardia endophytica]